MSTSTQWCCRCTAHRSEVCGLKWSPDNRQLASGGNDNQLCIWDLQNSQPSMKFGEHSAAVKAIAWSPHQHGLLASGGGTADRCIRFWNTATQAKLNTIDTGSQVRSIWYCIVCACVDKLVERQSTCAWCVRALCASMCRCTCHLQHPQSCGGRKLPQHARSFSTCQCCWLPAATRAIYQQSCTHAGLQPCMEQECE